MALSPKQLRLVFAKLREKGLLRYVKKGRSLGFAERAGKAYSKPLKPSAPIIDQARVSKLISRLPQRMQRPQPAVELHQKPWGPFLGPGSYFDSTRTIKLSSDVSTYTSRSWSDPTRVFYPRKKPGPFRYRTYQQRTGLLGSAKVFYHEYGHFLDRAGRRYSKTRAWKDITSKEWGDFRYGYRKIYERVEPEETFAEAFSFYASTKTSRSRLKKERPLSYGYMERFFREG